MRVFSNIPTEASSGGDFKDVLLTILAIAAIAITAFGFGAYRLLSQQLHDEIERSVESKFLRGLSYNRVSLGFVYWRLYENFRPDRTAAESYLDKAIEQTRSAYVRYAALLDTSDRAVDRLISDIRNNWAAYIVEKDSRFGPVEASDRAAALACAEHLTVRIANFPAEAVGWQDTIEAVRNRFA